MDHQYLQYGLKIIAFLGTLGGLAYLVSIWKIIRKFFLSNTEKDILKMMYKDNNRRILIIQNRDDWCLYLKKEWTHGPYPSNDPLEISKFYEGCERLIENKYIRQGDKEIFVLTSKGIKKAKRLCR